MTSLKCSINVAPWAASFLYTSYGSGWVIPTGFRA